MKIVYCLNSIKGIGGIQRVTIVKANVLADIQGNDVYIITTDNHNEIQCEVLSSRVKLIDLNINYYADDWQKGWQSRFSQIQKKIRHRQQLKKTLNKIKPDIVISVGQSEKFYCIKGFVKTSKPLYLREFHFATNYRLHFAVGFKNRLLAYIHNLFDFQVMCRFFYDAVICLTPEDLQENWKGRNNIFAIPNPVTVAASTGREVVKKNIIIAVGRLTKVKNFASLIRAFSLITSKNPSWVLQIFGDGEDRAMLEHLIGKYNIENQVQLCGYTANIEEHLAHSSIFVSTSLTEGFPLVLFEAMTHHLPVVSYKNYGSNFIIDHGKNGFLVDLNKESQLSSELQKLISDRDLRKGMANSGYSKAQSYAPRKIAIIWMDLFVKLNEKKRK